MVAVWFVGFLGGCVVLVFYLPLLQHTPPVGCVVAVFFIFFNGILYEIIYIIFLYIWGVCVFIHVSINI